jgi:hypothetical protein|tara:strand:+ start:5415 stop:5945 length:531 start_codon:yes stop_codon:yes gene_type:complete
MDATTSTTNQPIFTEDFIKSEVARLKSELYSANAKLKNRKLSVEKITQDDIREKFARVSDAIDYLLTKLSDDCDVLIANNYEYDSRSVEVVLDYAEGKLAERIGDLYRLLKGYQFLNEYRVSGTMDFTALIVAKSEEEAKKLAKEDIHARGCDYASDEETDSIDIDDVEYLSKAKD